MEIKTKFNIYDDIWILTIIEDKYGYEQICIIRDRILEIRIMEDCKTHKQTIIYEMTENEDMEVNEDSNEFIIIPDGDVNELNKQLTKLELEIESHYTLNTNDSENEDEDEYEDDED